MSFSMFGIFGYVSVMLLLAALVLFVLHFRRRPRRWLCHYAIGCVFVALLLAQVNSLFHVNNLQVDQSEAIAAAQARQAEARRMAEQERADDVAQIRFAEDASTDFLDMAGLDEADRKYIESMDETLEPQWRQQKRQRSATGAQDDSLEAQLDTTEKAGGVDSKLNQKEKRAIVLPEKVVLLANRLDGMLLKTLRFLLLVGFGAIVVDYLQRVNRFDEAYFLLPLPSTLVNGTTPLASIYKFPRNMSKEAFLRMLARRGDTFLYLTGAPLNDFTIPESLPRLPRGSCPLDVIYAAQGDPLVDDTFLFEGLWFNRAAFVVDSLERAEGLLMSFYEQLMQRRRTRARLRQTVHVIWDLEIPLQDALQEEILQLFAGVGICFCECEVRS